MNTFITADTHFGHGGIVKHQQRPFRDVDHMNEVLIQNWNQVVGKDDIVYHLGDFCWGGPISASVYRRRLNGRIHLIIGNHDKYALREPELWDSISHYKEANIQSPYLPNGRQIIILCHYAFRVWNGSHNGTWHLYGHSHGSLKDDPNALSLDVGVDCWDYFPVSCSQLANAMSKKTFKPVDHHGKDNLDKNIMQALME